MPIPASIVKTVRGELSLATVWLVCAWVCSLTCHRNERLVKSFRVPSFLSVRVVAACQLLTAACTGCSSSSSRTSRKRVSMETCCATWRWSTGDDGGQFAWMISCSHLQLSCRLVLHLWRPASRLWVTWDLGHVFLSPVRPAVV